MRRRRRISTLPNRRDRFKAWTLLMVMLVLTSGLLTDIMAALSEEGMVFVEIVENEPDGEEESEVEWDDFITEMQFTIASAESDVENANCRESFKLIELHYDITTPPPEGY